MEVFSLPFFILKVTWWFITPLILLFIFRDLWLYWRGKLYLNSLEWTLLEIKVPKDILKTPKAMEYVFVGLHGVWDDLNMRDIWIKGESLPRFSMEIVGIEGEMRLFIHTQTPFRDLVEAKIYSQYPDAEIVEAEDYTNLLPPDAPNKDWDLWGTDLRLNMPDPYPLRTYVDFEEMVEERRLDSMAPIAEAINKLRAGEHMWIQILISPVMYELREEGEGVVKKLMGRPIEEKKGAIGSVASLLSGEAMQLFGRSKDKEEEEQPFLLPEFRLSAGEREVIKRVEEKTSKVAFEVMIRFIYIARSGSFNKSSVAALFGFFRQFNTYNLNAFRPNTKTLPKKSFIWFKKTRTHFRKLRLLKWYKMRDTLPGGISPKFMLNVEELASIFHCPCQVVKAPSMPFIGSKKSSPPFGLPVE